MRRLVFVLGILAVILAPALVHPRSVAACSAGGDWDAIDEADVIIAGRVLDMRLAPLDRQIPYPNKSGGTAAYQPGEYHPVWIDFEVDSYLKGSGPASLTALDATSVVFMGQQTVEERAEFEGAEFWGSGGACGALNSDPRDQYWVTGLSLRDGIYRTNLLLLFAIGSGPDDPILMASIEGALADRLGPGITPAATGHGLHHSTDGAVPIAFGVLGLVILCSARLRIWRWRSA